MTDEKIHIGARVPKSIINWIKGLTNESGRTFSGELVYQLGLLKRGRRPIAQANYQAKQKRAKRSQEAGRS